MQNKQLSLEGVIVPLVVPVTEKGRVDFDGVAKLSKWLVDSGVDGIFVAGTSGRFSHFSPKQNKDICKSVKEAVGDRAVICGGASDSGLFRILENAENMMDAGADVVVTTAPYYLSYTIQESEDVLRKVADESPLPVVYYNIPEFVRYGLRAEFLEEMADHPNVAGYKDSSNDLEHHLDVLKRTKGKAFDVLIGKELILTQTFKAGTKGMVLSFNNLYPKLFVDFIQAVKQADWSRVDKLQDEVAQKVQAFVAFHQAQPQMVFSNLMKYFESEYSKLGFSYKLI